MLDTNFGPLGRNQHPARRGTILFDCHPDLRSNRRSLPNLNSYRDFTPRVLFAVFLKNSLQECKSLFFFYILIHDIFQKKLFITVLLLGLSQAVRSLSISYWMLIDLRYRHYQSKQPFSFLEQKYRHLTPHLLFLFLFRANRKETLQSYSGRGVSV